MKGIRFGLCALFLFGGMVLQAAPVSQNRALDVARKVFAGQPATKAAGEVKLLWDGEDIATKSTVQPAFYVFTRDGGGFVIIAGDDNVQPILAFSEDSPFAVEGMPENVKWWMDQIKNHVRSARTQSPEIALQWSGLMDTKAKIDESLLSPTSINTHSATVCWNQSAPANEMAPTYANQNNTQSVCGCLPLAMSEILTWFGWPNQGVGSTSEYQYYPVNVGLTTIPSRDLTALTITDEQWLSLQALDTYQEFVNCTDPIRSKLSELVYDCGLLLKAKFNAGGNFGGTGAYSVDVPSAFSEHMKYNKGCYLDFLSNHTIDEWNGLLKLQVLDHPVLYCGVASLGGGNDAGHAYVLDGYAQMNLSGEDVFHFNFGWGGACNGYYYSNYQDQRGGVENSPYSFDMQLQALFDFIPDKIGNSEAKQRLIMESNSFLMHEDPEDDTSPIITHTYIGMRAAAPIEKNVAIPLEVCYTNYSTEKYNGIVKLVLEESNGTPIETLDVFDWGAVGGLPVNMSYFYLSNYPSSSFTISKDFGFGDRLVLYYTDDLAKSNYVRMIGALDGSVVFELPVMPVPFIKTDDSYTVGKSFQFQLMNYDGQYLGTKWTITDPDGNVSSNLPQSQREFKLTKSGNYKIQATVASTVGGAEIETIVTFITVD